MRVCALHTYIVHSRWKLPHINQDYHHSHHHHHHRQIDTPSVLSSARVDHQFSSSECCVWNPSSNFDITQASLDTIKRLQALTTTLLSAYASHQSLHIENLGMQVMNTATLVKPSVGFSGRSNQPVSASSSISISSLHQLNR